MFRRLFGAGLLLAAFAFPADSGCPRLPRRKKDNEKDDNKGWMQLFNGKDLTGWKTHPDDKGHLEGQGRHPDRQRPDEPPVQRERRLRELHLPRRGQDQRQAATAASISAPSSATSFPEGLRGADQQHPRRPDQDRQPVSRSRNKFPDELKPKSS